MEGAATCITRADLPIQSIQFETSTFGGVCGHLPKNFSIKRAPHGTQKTAREGTPCPFLFANFSLISVGVPSARSAQQLRIVNTS
jgi:hypothetical protein